MECHHCQLTDSIDCIVFLPGTTSCARCGAEMSAEQLVIAREFYPWGRELPGLAGSQPASQQFTEPDGR